MPETTSSLLMTRPSSRRIARANWPRRIFGPCDTTAISLMPARSRIRQANAERRAVLRQNHGILDIVNIPHQTHFPNIDLLQTGFDEASTSIGVVVGDLLLHLADAEAVGDQLVWVDANLVFARGSAETGNIHDVGNGLEILLHHPVFNGLQLHDVIRRVGGV